MALISFLSGPFRIPFSLSSISSFLLSLLRFRSLSSPLLRRGLFSWIVDSRSNIILYSCPALLMHLSRSIFVRSLLS